MKTFLFALLGLAMLAAGCTKELSVENKADNGFYVRFLLNGESKEYTKYVMAVRSRDSSLEKVKVQGVVDQSVNPAGVALQVSRTDSVIAQTYPEVFGADSPAILYRDTSRAEFSNLFMTGPSGFEIVISEINTETVRGTFKGKIADINGEVKEISDGSFYAKFQ